MSAAGFTPIQLYRSTTASAVPTSGNLADGELAINTNDGKLYYKDSGGAVQLIASKAGASGDVVGPASATDNAVVRFDGTTGKLVQNSVVTIADSTGDIAGAGSITSTSASGILTRAAATQDGVELIGRAGGSSSYKVTLTPTTLGGNRTLTLPDTTGTVALTGSTVASFSAGSTGFTPNSATTGAVTLAGTLATTNGGTGLTSFTANQVFYASSTSAVAQSSNLQFSGTDLTVYGLTVGRGAGAVSTNTAVGASALAANTSGIQNNAFGNLALTSATSNGYNDAFGYTALQYNTGAANAAFGNSAMRGVNGSSTGGSNAAFGASALIGLTTGANNVAVGTYALQANTTASNNTAVGYQAGYSNTTGAQNFSGGYQAGYAVTTGNWNTLLGTQAGLALTTGTANTFVGASGNGGAGYLITTGSKNTIIGGYSGNQGGLDIRTASNYIVLSDGDGNPRGIFDNQGNFYVGCTTNGALNNNSINFNLAAGYGFNSHVNHENGTASGVPYFLFNYNASTIGSIVQNGTAGVLYNITSDYRLKNVIGEVTGAGDRIDALEPVEYEWKASGERTRGFLAHKFQEVYPQSVSGTKDAVDAGGNPVYQAMQASTSEVIADLVAEIQSLRARVAQLESKGA